MKKTLKLLKEDLISFETAKLAKRAGFWFDGNTNNWLDTTLPYLKDGTRRIDFTYHGEYYSAPTQSLLLKWLREQHGMLVESHYKTFGVKSCNGYFYLCATKKDWKTDNYFGRTIFEGYEKYEQALEVGLQVGLKIVISKQKNDKHKKTDGKGNSGTSLS